MEGRVLTTMLRTLFVLTFVLPAVAAGQESHTLLDRASRQYGSMDGLCAAFDQILEVPLLGQRTPSAGTLCQLDPGFFRMAYDQPAGDLVVVDGEYLWLYTPSSHPGQAVRTALRNTVASVNFHREFLENPREKYDVEDQGTETLTDRNLRRLQLTPRSTSLYRTATLWIDPSDAMVYRVRIEQENGTVRTVDLSEIEVNPAITATYFAFRPPPGVTVITR